jgi:hypothetical protein
VLELTQTQSRLLAEKDVNERHAAASHVAAIFLKQRFCHADAEWRETNRFSFGARIADNSTRTLAHLATPEPLQGCDEQQEYFC